MALHDESLSKLANGVRCFLIAGAVVFLGFIFSYLAYGLSISSQARP